MTATERVLAHFERISEAPDAIPRLRRFVLDLAVRGRLVDPDPNDEPASGLMGRIASARVLLVKDGGRRRGTSLPPVTLEEQPFEVPGSWRWVRFADIADFSAGRTPSRNDSSFWNSGDHAWVSIADMDDGQVLKATKETVSAKARERVFGSEPEPLGTILMSFKLTIGKIVRLGIPAFHNEAIVSIRPHLAELDPYLFKVLPQFARQGDTKGAIKGATLNRESIANILVPLPPGAEQHRIVAKVDELMALCDRLEAAQKERESRRDRLVSASLARLNQPADTPSLREHPRFHLDHLPRMTTSRAHVQQLRETILELGVSGRLVAQDPKDEPAQAAIARADAVRRSTAETDRRADADPQTLLALNDRWEVPPSWIWKGLADIALFIDYRGQTPVKTDQGIRLITAKNVRPGAISLTPEEFVSEATYQKWMTRGLPAAGDVLFTTEAPMGNAAVIGLRERFALAQRVICFRSYGALEPGFLELQLLARPFQSVLEKTATGLTAKGIKAAKLKRLPVAVPPLGEQRRIVAKVDELMVVCDRLEAQLEAGRAARGSLLEATLRDVLTASEMPPMMAAE